MFARIVQAYVMPTPLKVDANNDGHVSRSEAKASNFKVREGQTDE